MVIRSATRSRSRSRILVVVIAVLLMTTSAAFQGWRGAVLFTGLCIGLIGVGATLLGRARWVHIGRRTGALMIGLACATVVTVGAADGLTGPSRERPRTTAAPTDTAAEAPVTGERVDVDPATGLLTDLSTEQVIEDAPSASALAVLGSLMVKGRAPRNGYDRDEFGDAWADTDRNGCDTRNDILARDLTEEVFKSDTRDCVVKAGTLVDPYSGQVIQFLRGQGTSDAVQIDHVVALADAWRKGAQSWTSGRRLTFANDPLNLLAVDGPLNMEKSDGDAATWLPPNRSYRCQYVARQVAVKASYDLWVTQAEKNAIATVLIKCPTEALPTR